MTRRERKKLEAKKAIISAAISLFQQKGFADTTIADIMDEADFGIGTFYNYFQSKEEILKHFLGEIIVDLNNSYLKLAASDKSAADILAQMMLLTGQLLDENRFVLPLFLSIDYNHTAGKKAVQEDTLTFKAIFVKIVRKGQAAGEFRRDISAEVITEMFHAIFQAAAFSNLNIAFMENVKDKLTLILEGIKSI
jgi:AcrR family transcriptional regulator